MAWHRGLICVLMGTMHRIAHLLCLLSITSQLHAAELEGAKRVKFLNYPDCIELSNPGGTVVVLCHQVGGRVLSYSHQGKESLYIDPKERQWTPGGNCERCGE